MSANTDIVAKFLEAWSRNQLDELMSYFGADAVYHNIPVDPVVGVEAIRAVIQGFAGMASEIEWVTRSIAENADGVVLTERLDRFKMGDKWVELPVMGAFELREGKIAAWRDYFDMAQFQRQLPA